MFTDNNPEVICMYLQFESLCNTVDSKTFLRADLGLSADIAIIFSWSSTRVCSQAQAFYERELEAMKRTQQLTADNLLAWKRTEAELRREFQTQEAALQKTLGKLRAELAKVTDEARENRDKSHKLQASLTAAENNIKVSAQCLSCNKLIKGFKMFALKFMLQKWEWKADVQIAVTTLHSYEMLSSINTSDMWNHNTEAHLTASMSRQNHFVYFL